MQTQKIEIDYSTEKEHCIFLCSDLHFGNKGQNKELLREEFDEAKRLDAMIFIAGDWGDFILSGDRKRYSPSHDAYGTDNNVNMAIDEAYNFFSDYIDNIKMIGTGNHEVSVSRFHQFDPTQQLIYSLNKSRGSKIVHGQYSGFIELSFHNGDSGKIRKEIIFYNHGQGGTAEITKGAIDLNRMMTTKLADIYWIGHKHTKLVLPCEGLLYLNNTGEICNRERLGVVTGSYLNIFDEYNAMKEGYRLNYGEERMRTLQSTGGVFIKFHPVDRGIRRKVIM